MSFAHLHVHTTYSLMDGLSSVRELFDRAEELGQPGIAITDHGYMYGVPEFLREAERHPDVKPVVGCEIYITDHYDHRIMDPDHKRYHHLILLAKNMTGYRNLVKICSEAAVSGKYYRPRVSHEFIERHHEGLIAMSACIGGEIPACILDDDMESAEKAVQWYRSVFGDDFFLEVSQHESRKPGFKTDVLEMQRKANRAIFALGEKFGISVVATNDVHFVYAEDASAQDTHLCNATGKVLSDTDRLCYSGEEYLKSEAEMLSIFPDHPEAVANSVKLLDKIEKFSIFTKPRSAAYPIPEMYRDADEALRGKVFWYLKDLSMDGNDEYVERVEKELEMIRERGCADIFLVVSDLCDNVWKAGGIVGPGRGATASLLVNYLLGITDMNPMEFGLVPEKFFSHNPDMFPNFAIDFDETGRLLAEEYLKDKYSGHVAGIITLGSRSAKTAVRDSFRAHELPSDEADEVCRIIDGVRSSGIRYYGMHSDFLSRQAVTEGSPVADWYAGAGDRERLAFDTAARMEGSVRYTGVHACGWVLSSAPIDEAVPLTLAVDDETGVSHVVSQYDGHYVEDCGLVKIDLLSLSALSVMMEADPVSMNDRETLELFADGDTVGVFQFAAKGMRDWLRRIRPESFEDLVALNAMYRPGPMERLGDYAEIKNGSKRNAFPDVALSGMQDIVEETYGMIIYQEQLMDIVSRVASFSHRDRRLLSKFAGSQTAETTLDGARVNVLDYLMDRFIREGVANGYGRDELERFWNGFVRSREASFLFGKAHSVCYTYIAYRCAYLKAHDPARFYSTVCPTLKWEEEKQALYEDAGRHGLVFMPQTGCFYSVIDD